MSFYFFDCADGTFFYAMCLYSRVGEDDAAPAASSTVSSHQLPSSGISRLQETKVLPCIPSRSGRSLTAPGGHFHSPVKAVQASREQRTMGACRPMVTVDAHFAWSLTPLYVSEKLPAVLTLMMVLDLHHEAHLFIVE